MPVKSVCVAAPLCQPALPPALPLALRPGPHQHEDAHPSGLSSSIPDLRVCSASSLVLESHAPHQLHGTAPMSWKTELTMSSAIKSSLIHSAQSVTASLVPLFNLVQSFLHSCTHSFSLFLNKYYINKHVAYVQSL